jgi:hypothetical protein
MTAFFTSEISFNVAYVAAPMHVARQRYLVTPAVLAPHIVLGNHQGASILKHCS